MPKRTYRTSSYKLMLIGAAAILALTGADGGCGGSDDKVVEPPKPEPCVAKTVCAVSYSLAKDGKLVKDDSSCDEQCVPSAGIIADTCSEGKDLRLACLTQGEDLPECIVADGCEEPEVPGDCDAQCVPDELPDEACPLGTVLNCGTGSVPEPPEGCICVPDIPECPEGLVPELLCSYIEQDDVIVEFPEEDILEPGDDLLDEHCLIICAPPTPENPPEDEGIPGN